MNTQEVKKVISKVEQEVLELTDDLLQQKAWATDEDLPKLLDKRLALGKGLRLLTEPAPFTMPMKAEYDYLNYQKQLLEDMRDMQAKAARKADMNQDRETFQQAVSREEALQILIEAFENWV